MSEECGAFLWGELGEQQADAMPKFRNGSLGRLAQMRLELGECQLDRIEIGRVGRQIEQLRASRLDEVTYPHDLVSRQVVHDDGIAFAQGGDQHLRDVNKKGLAVHRPIEDERGDQAGTAQTGGEGGRLPVPPRSLRNQASAPGASAAQARHLGVGAGLVDEDQLVGIETGLVGFPVFPALSDVGPVLFARAQAFF